MSKKKRNRRCWPAKNGRMPRSKRKPMEACLAGFPPNLEEPCDLRRVIQTELDGYVVIPRGVTPDPEVVVRLRGQACSIVYDDGAV